MAYIFFFCYLFKDAVSQHRTTEVKVRHFSRNVKSWIIACVIETNLLKQQRQSMRLIYLIILNYYNFVGFEVSTAATMKNSGSWDIKTRSVPHRKHITSPLQSPAG
jgi:hypothetical protein